MKVKLFCYGSLVLPRIQNSIWQKTFTPTHSVVLQGFKVVLEPHPRNPCYLYMLLVSTGEPTDLVPGVLIDLPAALLPRTDKWEGSGFMRVEIQVLDRSGVVHNCQTYIKRNNNVG